MKWTPILLACLLALEVGCSAGSLGVNAGTGSVHGRILRDGVPADHVRVMARSRRLLAETGNDGLFFIDGVEPGAVQVVSVDRFGAGAVLTAPVVADATTGLGDIAIREDAVSSLILLRGFGLEERLTRFGTDLSGVVFDSAGTVAYALTRTASLQPVLAIDTATGAVDELGSLVPPQPGVVRRLEIAGDALVVWDDAIVNAYVFDLRVPRRNQQIPRTVNLLFLGRFERHWISGSILTVLSSAGNFNTSTLLYTVQRIDLGDLDHPRPTRRLGHGARMALSSIDLASNGDVIYAPLFGCDGNPDCTAEERADEAAGLLRIQRLGWSDGADVLVGKVADGLVASAHALGDRGYYVLHRGVVSRVDLATGDVRDVLIAFGPRDGLQATLQVSPEEVNLLLGVTRLPLQLVELPSLARHDLVFGSTSPPPCCDEHTSIEFRPGGALVASTASRQDAGTLALWLDFTANGILRRSRSLLFQPAAGGPTLPRLLRRGDGSEVAAGRAPGLLHDQLFTTPPDGIQFQQLSFIDADHLSPALTGDGRYVLYAMRDPLSGSVQLFRMELQ